MKTLLLAATALAILGGAASAQTSNSGSNSNARAINSSGSQSSSVSNPRVNVIGNPIGNGASSSNSGAKASASTRSASLARAVGNTTTVNVSTGAVSGTNGGSSSGAASDPPAASGTSGANSGGDPTINYSGSYTVRNVPEVIPPSVVGGNACAVGASGGMAVAGFGIAAGGTWADRACERRQQAALLFNMGEQKVALELMCQDEHVREAMKTSGKPCSADVVAQAPAAVTPAAQAAPVKLAAATPAQAPEVAKAPAAPKPEWCSRAAPSTEASKAFVEQACGK